VIIFELEHFHIMSRRPVCLGPWNCARCRQKSSICKRNVACNLTDLTHLLISSDCDELLAICECYLLLQSKVVCGFSSSAFDNTKCVAFSDFSMRESDLQHRVMIREEKSLGDLGASNA